MYPTPNTGKGGGSSRSGDRRGETPSLEGMARKGLLYPTPSATVYGSSVNGILRHGGESSAGEEKPRPGAGRPSLETMARHGSWPTPTVGDADSSGSRRAVSQKAHAGTSLCDAIQRQWATPAARDYRSGKASEATHARGSRPLNEQVIREGGRRWPTASSTDGKGSYREGQRRGQLTEVAGPGRTPDMGRLNPDWVEWLMGWPLGWTDLVGSPLEHYGWEVDPADVDLVPRVVQEHYKGRRERLKALGNGMVPQCARLGWGLEA